MSLHFHHVALILCDGCNCGVHHPCLVFAELFWYWNHELGLFLSLSTKAAGLLSCACKKSQKIWKLKTLISKSFVSQNLEIEEWIQSEILSCFFLSTDPWFPCSSLFLMYKKFSWRHCNQRSVTSYVLT